jgi:hypothetical protein
MKPEGRVLLVERVILPGKTPELLVLETDIHMLFALPFVSAASPRVAPFGSAKWVQLPLPKTPDSSLRRIAVCRA